MEKYKIAAIHPESSGLQDLILIGKNASCGGDINGSIRNLTVARKKDGLKRGGAFNIYTTIKNGDLGGRVAAYTYNYNGKLCMDFPNVPLSDAAIKDFFKQLPGVRQGSMDSICFRVDMMRALCARGIKPSMCAYSNMRALLDVFFEDRRRFL